MSGRVILKNPGIDINQYLKWAGNPPIDIFIRQSNYFASENRSVTSCLKAEADGAVYDAMMRYPDGRHSVDGR